MDTGTEARRNLIERRENQIRSTFMEACYLVYSARIDGWTTGTIDFIRMTLDCMYEQSKVTYSEVKELAVLIGIASKAGYTAFWLREIKRLLTDCESEWSGTARQAR